MVQIRDLDPKKADWFPTGQTPSVRVQILSQGCTVSGPMHLIISKWPSEIQIHFFLYLWGHVSKKKALVLRLGYKDFSLPEKIFITTYHLISRDTFNILKPILSCLLYLFFPQSFCLYVHFVLCIFSNHIHGKTILCPHSQEGQALFFSKNIIW